MKPNSLWLYLQFGWYANPVVFGDYPEVMKEHIGRRSKAAGFKKSLLPEFSKRASEKLKGTHDFIGVNMYTSNLAKAINYKTDSVFWQDCFEVDTYQPDTWNRTTDLDWFRVSKFYLHNYILHFFLQIAVPFLGL